MHGKMGTEQTWMGEFDKEVFTLVSSQIYTVMLGTGRRLAEKKKERSEALREIV